MGGGSRGRGDDGEGITKSGFKAPLACPHGGRGGEGVYFCPLSYIWMDPSCSENLVHSRIYNLTGLVII